MTKPRAIFSLRLLLLLAGLALGLAVFAAQEPSTASADPVLSIVKSAAGLHTGGANDGAREYRLQARNAGDPIPGGSTVTIRDDIDNDLVVLAIHNVNANWSCVLGAGNVLTCTLNAGAQLGSINEDIVFYDTCDTIVRGSVDNVADIRLNNVVQNSDTANPNVFDCTAPNLAIDKTGPASVPEGTAPAGSPDYTIVVSNTGQSPTTGTVTVTDTLPDGLTGVTASGSGWDCNPSDAGSATFSATGPTSNTTFICTRSDALAGGQSYPAINVDFTAPNDNCQPITNRVSASGGGDTGTNPDATDEVETLVTGCTEPFPNLTLDKTGPTSVPEGTSPAGSADYTIVVGSNGNAPTSGTVTVTDNLPNGLTGVTASGTGWDCNPGDAGSTTFTAAGPTNNTSFTCTRSDALPTGQSYPPINVNFTAPNDVCDPITNYAEVSGGGDAGPNPDDSDSVITQVTGCAGSIKIIKDTNPETDDEEFDFSGDLGDFTLMDDGSRLFSNLSPGTYDVTESDLPDNWELDSIVCTGGDYTVTDETVSIQLDAGENVVCTFTNEEDSDRKIPTPTPTATPSPTPTPTPSPTPTPNFFEQRGSAGGAVLPLQPQRPQATPVAPQQQAPSVIQPPRTGDGGLFGGDGDSTARAIGLIGLSFGLTLAVAVAVRRIAR